MLYQEETAGYIDFFGRHVLTSIEIQSTIAFIIAQMITYWQNSRAVILIYILFYNTTSHEQPQTGEKALTKIGSTSF